MTTYKFTPLILIIFLLVSCSGEVSLTNEKATEQILALHQLQRKYPFEKMTKEFVDQLSENHFSVNRGEIKQMSKEALYNRFQSYFDVVEFEKWDDANPSIIKFSDDLSMAQTIVDKEVIVNFQDENGVTQKELTKFAWVAVYKREGSDWKIECVASTNKESNNFN